MQLRSRFAAALGLAAVLSPILSRGDEGDVSPPPVPAAQMPDPARSASAQPQGWLPNAAQPSKATPTASPQSFTATVASAPVAAAPQTVSFQVQLVPTQAVAAAPVAVPYQAVAAPAPALQVAHSQAPGPIGRAVGKVGQCLTRAGMTRLYVPTQEVQQVVYTTTQAVQVPTQTYVAAPAPVQVPVQASAQSSTPPVPRKGWLHH